MREVQTMLSGSRQEESARTAPTRAEFAARFAEARPVLRSIAGAVMGSPSAVDDIVQEAVLIALQKLESFEPGTSFTAWMGQIVRFVALNAVRRRARPADRTSDSSSLERVADYRSSPDYVPVERMSQMDARDLPFDDRVLAALSMLDQTPRMCLLFRTLHDMPYRRIAQILDIPEGTAMSHVHRARRTMRAQLTSDRESIDA